MHLILVYQPQPLTSPELKSRAVGYTMRTEDLAKACDARHMVSTLC